MNPRRRPIYLTHFLTLLIIGAIFEGCGPNQAAQVASTPRPTAAPTDTSRPTTHPAETPTPTTIPFPELTLDRGAYYFSLDGQQRFLFSRNVTGKDQRDFDTLREWTTSGGSRLIRVHLTHGWWGSPWVMGDGAVNDAWVARWESFFDQAEADGIYILPVFGVWADWNNGTPDYGSPFWRYNPLNPANGGSVASPEELFQPGSATQELWLAWLDSLVRRWQGQRNIAGWEIFSELNIASGSSEDAAVDLADRAASIIRAADPVHRPITASLAGVYQPTDPWAEFYTNDTIDFIEIHPYTAQLDRELIAYVRRELDRYGKPVFIGESGLNAYDLEYAEEARLGIRHAIWAGMVSGAMNGRSLWSEDGYAIYSEERPVAFEFMKSYATTEQAAARFVEGVDFSDLAPLAVQYPSGNSVWGAAVGREDLVIGWFRDAACEPPNWPLQPVIVGQRITLFVPGSAANWRVDFYDTITGTDIVSSVAVTRSGSTVTIPLSDFTDDIAFKMVAED